MQNSLFKNEWEGHHSTTERYSYGVGIIEIVDKQGVYQTCEPFAYSLN